MELTTIIEETVDNMLIENPKLCRKETTENLKRAVEAADRLMAQAINGLELEYRK
jgi:hypothetical protein